MCYNIYSGGMVIFQVIDDKDGCFGIYTNGTFIYDRFPSNMTGTWAWSRHLLDVDCDYAFVWNGGKTLSNSCPEQIKKRFEVFDVVLKIIATILKI